MRARPILFNGPMVRALLDGSKTQTRRVVKSKFEIDYLPLDLDGPIWPHHSTYSDAFEDQPMLCPYGQPGDRLWVREAHYLTDDGHSEFAVYAADDDATQKHLQRLDGLNADFPADVKAAHKRLRPSIHMPRWASRITLEIVKVRVERLQDISDLDAKAEGSPDYQEGIDEPAPGEGYEWSFRKSYRRLWETINGAGTWEANPWVWVIEFKKATA